MNRFQKAGAALAFAVTFIVGREGIEYVAYQDEAGVWTICAGRTEGVKRGMVATPEMCDDFARADVAERWDAADRLIVLPMRPWQQVAVTSLIFNIGEEAFRKSTVRRLANQGDWQGACDAFLMWNKLTQNGRLRFSQGLMNRRQAERLVCRGEDFDGAFDPNHRPLMLF